MGVRMKGHVLRVAAIAALVLSPVVAGCAARQDWTPALAGSAPSRSSILAEADIPPSPVPVAPPRTPRAPAAPAVAATPAAPAAAGPGGTDRAAAGAGLRADPGVARHLFRFWQGRHPAERREDPGCECRVAARESGPAPADRRSFRRAWSEP